LHDFATTGLVAAARCTYSPKTENPDRSEDPSGFLFLQWLNTAEVRVVYRMIAGLLMGYAWNLAAGGIERYYHVFC
jgi:hypothetical protein